MIDPILAISPLDGRYNTSTEALRDFYSEFGLNRYRIKVEIEWLIFLCNEVKIQGAQKLTELDTKFLREIVSYFDVVAAKRLKEIEKETNHDVKAVEYYIKESLATSNLSHLLEFVHLGCTSEDINNTAYALLTKEACHGVTIPALTEVATFLANLAGKTKALPLMSLTHGQPASPTTLGKELINVLARLETYTTKIKNHEYTAKWNGAVGNYNAMAHSISDVDWIETNKKFIESLGLTPNLYTTQIEPHDNIAELLNLTTQINTILIDFSRDAWMYIQRDVFKQRLKEGEIGSSTMPHKVNPIDFENAEGNLGLSTAIAQHMATKLPVSRMQRDLSDSTVLRNLGIVFGYNLIAVKSLLKGLGKLEVNEEKCAKELEDNPELLAEIIQTVMRLEGIEKPYEKLKELTRGKKITLKEITAFVKKLEIDEKSKKNLLNLTSAKYTGNAEKLTEHYLKNKK